MFKKGDIACIGDAFTVSYHKYAKNTFFWPDGVKKECEVVHVENTGEYAIITLSVPMVLGEQLVMTNSMCIERRNNV